MDVSWLTFRLYKRRNEFPVLSWHISKLLTDDATMNLPEYKDTQNETKVSMDMSLKTYTKYLRQIAHIPEISWDQKFLEFCETSTFTMTNETTWWFKEGIMKKWSGGRHKHEWLSVLWRCGKCCWVWAFRWFIVTDQYICYLRNNKGKDSVEMMLID